jgi:4-amino-4-deoxy-L-arabinose transferase-like glycosyltransferase
LKPFLVTPQQTAKLPRWVLMAACLLYVVPGLWGRDPWRFDDAAGFGIAWTMATGSRGLLDWLMPNVVGIPMFQEGPLPFWLGALTMRALPWLDAATAMRVTAIGWVSLFLIALWQCTRLLARRPEVQPFDPFGASATPRDYGRAVADSALFVAMATFGLLTRIHETTAESAVVAWVTLFLFGMALALERPRIGGGIAGSALALCTITRGLPTSAALGLSLLTLLILVRQYRLIMRPLLGSLLPAALLGSALWLAPLAYGGVLTEPYLERWLGWNRWLANGPSLETLGYLARTAPWFFWPAWPLASWALWRWRDRLGEPALALPATSAAFLLILTLIAPRGGDATLVPVVAPLAILAAFSLPTIRRGVVNLIDWFAVMTFSLVGLALWLYWIAFQTGWPPRMALRVQQAVPGFAPYFNVIELTLGLVVTLAWLGLVAWRIARHPTTLWRSVTLSAGGMILAWCLLMTLWLPAANFRKTYRDVAQQVGAVVAPHHRCVRTRGIYLAQRACIAYFGQLKLDDQRGDCEWLLVFDHQEAPLDAAGLKGRWSPVWSGQRPADRRERFKLYRRHGA